MAASEFSSSFGLKIVLLGTLNAGKSCTGNTILGQKEFDTINRTDRCVERQGEAAGRRVTVVEAPGWRANDSLWETPEAIKEEIELSVCLCFPGPHALLLVIRLDSAFRDTHRTTVQEHIEILGEKAWRHTIVLFTHGDRLRDTSIEQHIESGGESLQWLVEKCGNRYHVLNNHKRDDHMQVTQLMEKIEEMVAAKDGDCYDVGIDKIKELEERRRAMNTMKQTARESDHRRSLNSDANYLSELRILLVGHRHAGKSSSGNSILGREEFDTVERTARCVGRQGEVAQRQVMVVETPGWWANDHLEDTSKLTKEEIEFSVSLCPPGPHALLLHIRVETPFTEAHRMCVKEHLELLSKSVWSHTIVLFTYGDWLGDRPIEHFIERGGGSLHLLVEECGNRYHVLNNRKRGDHMQVTQLMEKIEEMVAGNDGHWYRMNESRVFELEEKRRRDEQRVKERKMKVERNKENLFNYS